MPVKFNKEMLIKQRFWVMLGASVALILGGIIFLVVAVSAEDTVNNIKKSITKVKGIKPGAVATQAAINERTKQAEGATKSESKVWSGAYAVQEPYFVWADPVEQAFDFQNGHFATDIKLSKDPGEKAWPPDTHDPTKGTNVIHGTIQPDQTESSFVLKTRKGEHTIHPTPKMSITIPDEKKQLQFNKLKDNVAGRLAAVTFQRGRYFGDPLTGPEMRVFSDKVSSESLITNYIAQVRPILEQVDPYDDKGKGVVQLKGWLYKADALPHEDPNAAEQRFINYVKVPWNLNSDFSKEAWIAQEDLWIQREIYRIIAEINRSVGVFDGKGGNEKNKAHVFTNPFFELQLVLLKDGSIDFTIKNRLHRRQRLDLNFSVKTNEQQGFKPEIIKISDDPLMPSGDAGKKDTITKRIGPKDVPRKGIFAVQQVLTWETAAVKRIDQISIGSNAGGEISHSHRTFIDSLRPFIEADKELPNFGQADKQPGPAPIGPGLRPPPGKGFPRPGLNKGPARNAFGPAGANVQTLEHGLWLTRYVEVSDQSRRIPVAIALIVDQDRVDRVLLHFNNSKLRFLETQVLLNYYPGSLQPPAPPDPKSNDPARPLGAFGPLRPGPGPVPGPGNQPAASGGSGEMETNMEIVIYGIMTLYQRYPPRPNMGPAPVNPAAPPPPPPADKAPR